ncbi:DUF6510 family protein [Streptomyces montanisoli]|uniref:Uncharacterized protein n=1 Tax=Streptomyces montanisoli TaxID=2798581 RepID=A0A940MBB0_9ACTN|nr:DUF6510 family protein [Streptomyces montanisoli]MBP0457753.1 hypothetical protein [Streptomyces montanisoli]
MTSEEHLPDDHVDGNALAGPLAEVFTADVTVAQSECAHCGATGPVARLLVYRDAPGLVARCQECGQVVLRYVRTASAAHLDMRGTVTLAFSLAPE